MSTTQTITLYGSEFTVDTRSIPWIARYISLTTPGPLTSKWQVSEHASPMPATYLATDELRTVQHYRGKFFRSYGLNQAANERIFIPEDKGDPVVIQNDKTVQIYANQAQYPGRLTLRFIREIVYRELLALGYLSFHAASVCFRGYGLLIVGPSGAGKTSLAIGLSSLGGTQFIANDRSLVDFSERNIRALPLPIRVARECLSSVDPLNTAKIRRLARSADPAAAKIEFLPIDLAELLACQIAASASLHLIVIPSITLANQVPRLVPISGDAADRVLEEEACSPCDPLWPDDWLVRSPKVASSVYNRCHSQRVPAVKLVFGADWYAQRATIGRLLAEYLTKEGEKYADQAS